MTDTQLLDLYRDPASRNQGFTALVSQYQQQVYYFVRKMVVDHDDANDVTQLVFIKVWKGLSGFKGDAKLSTWMYRIAMNESITFLNKKKKIAGIPLDQVEHSLSQSLEADVHYDGDAIQRKLQTAVATLPDKQRTVFILKYFEARQYKEISEITGTSVGALKASYHHAVQKIEKYLTAS